MNDELKRFLNKIEINCDIEDFNNASISKVVLNKSKDIMTVYIENELPFKSEVIFNLLNNCNNNFNDIGTVKLKFKYKKITDENIIDCYNFLINKLIDKRPSLSSLKENDVKIDKKTINVEVISKAEEQLLQNETDYLIKELVRYGYDKYSFKIKINKEKYEELRASIQEEKKENGKNKAVEKEDFLYGKKVYNEPVPIDSLIGESNNVTVEAYVFGIDTFEHEKIKIITLKISDKTNSILAKIRIFRNNDDDFEYLKKNIKEGKWYKMHGKVEQDNFAHDFVLFIYNMEEIESKDILITDDAPEKRVELHAHTMMSQMDGVIKVKDLINQANKFGHKAVAITDHNNLQSFPEAFNTKKGDLKVLYGVELSLVSDDIDIVINKKNYDLLQTEFVVFDIETTGFNANSDSIIEIGAVKIKNGEIIDKFDELINPKRKLPEKIIELTNITDEMLKDCADEETVVKKFLKWAGDNPMVAHNAKFDVSFIKRAINQYKLTSFKNTVVDTMEISRLLNPELFRHNLTAITKRYNIEFDEAGHHRADYDALATAYAFHKMCEILYNRNIEDIDDLYADVDKTELLKFSRPFHITALATNEIGLKNLFKIVTLANTDYLFKEPKIPRSVIESLREGLILGSGCINGEIFEAAKSKTEEELADMMSFYDYIEVNPPSTSEFLIESGRIGSKAELLNTINKIINVAIDSGKLVCATGDVHNLTKEDKIYRQIIVNQRVPSIGFHPLARVRDIPNAYFMTTEEMLNEFSFIDKDLAKKIVIDNPNKIADMCEELGVIKDKLYTPKMDKSDEITESMVYEKATSLYGDPLPEIVKTRIESELKGIIANGYSVLYLISEKLVKKSNNEGYFVGSRGSVGSSFVATMMGITEVNGLPAHYLCPECKLSLFEDDNNESFSLNYPSGYDLPDKKCPNCNTPLDKEGQDMPFATFLGFNAEKVPDIDLNFSGENQAAAHDYTKKLFGEKNVFRAGTISTVAEKTAFGFVKGYLEDKNIMLRNIEVERLAGGVTGVKRTTGQHPGGIIVIPDYMDVFDFTPYQYPADDTKAPWYTTHFDFHAIENNILKLDILGHDDPTMLKYLADSTKHDFMKIPFDDKKTLTLFSSCKELGVKKEQINCSVGTLGVPEMGTNFVIRMLEETKPKTFAEIVKISGLSHGTDVWNGNARDLVINKVVPFKNVIGCRDDIMVNLINYGMEPSLSFKIAEFVRKGRASKNPEIWVEYAQAMRENNIPDWFIDSCQKIKYMFPKAHATAYVMMGFRVAWYKLYYPIHYYSCYFGIRCFDFDIDSMVKGENALRAKIAEIQSKGFEATNKEQNTQGVLQSCLEMVCRGFSFKTIDLNKSDSSMFVIDEDEKSLIIPFKAIDGLGDSVAKKIITERDHSPFLSIEDLQNRCKINNTTLDRLRALGVLDGMPESNQLSLF